MMVVTSSATQVSDRRIIYFYPSFILKASQLIESWITPCVGPKRVFIVPEELFV